MPDTDLSTLPATIRYAALGDSSTEGLCDSDGAGGWIGWSQRVAHRFSQVHGDILWANLAVRGLTCRQILTTQLADAVALQPTHVTVVGGMNDLLRVIRPVEEVVEDLTTMLDTMMATGATVATVTLPDLSEVIPIARPLRSRLGQLNEAIRATADSGVTVVDLADSPLAADERLWADDRLHANSEGHRRIAEAVADGFGLPSGDWNDEPFTRDPVSWTRDDDRAWRRHHLYPWLTRRLRRESSANGVRPRHPSWIPIHPDDDLSDIASNGAQGGDRLAAMWQDSASA